MLQDSPGDQPSWAERVAAKRKPAAKSHDVRTRQGVTLKRPNTIRFHANHLTRLDAKNVYDAVEVELGTTETIKCIAILNNGWYNVTFDNEIDCESIAMGGVFLQGQLVQCERANIMNSVVVYVKAPYEMSDAAVVSALMQFGTATNIRRQVYDFDENVETGVRSVLLKNVKKPVPSFIRVGGFSLPVRHRGQEKTCKLCNQPGHFVRDCDLRGRCLVCGSRNHQAAWHRDNDDAEEYVVREARDNPEEETEGGSEGELEEAEVERREDDIVMERDHGAETSGEQPRAEGFWDEEVRKAAPRKRKVSVDEADEGASKLAREVEGMEVEKDATVNKHTGENDASQEAEEMVDVEQVQSTDNTQDSKQDSGPSVLEDSQDKESDDMVPYTRRGVQRFRKRRTSWERKSTLGNQLATTSTRVEEEQISRSSQSKKHSQVDKRSQLKDGGQDNLGQSQLHHSQSRESQESNSAAPCSLQDSPSNQPQVSKSNCAYQARPNSQSSPGTSHLVQSQEPSKTNPSRSSQPQNHNVHLGQRGRGRGRVD